MKNLEARIEKLEAAMVPQEMNAETFSQLERAMELAAEAEKLLNADNGAIEEV